MRETEGAGLPRTVLIEPRLSGCSLTLFSCLIWGRETETSDEEVHSKRKNLISSGLFLGRKASRMFLLMLNWGLLWRMSGNPSKLSFCEEAG